MFDYLFRKSAHDQKTFSMITPSEFLTRHDTHQIAAPSASSWGNEGHWSVWLAGSNSWIYPPLHMATVRLIALAGRFSHHTPPPPLAPAFPQSPRDTLSAHSRVGAIYRETRPMVP